MANESKFQLLGRRPSSYSFGEALGESLKGAGGYLGAIGIEQKKAQAVAAARAQKVQDDEQQDVKDKEKLDESREYAEAKLEEGREHASGNAVSANAKPFTTDDGVHMIQPMNARMEPVGEPYVDTDWVTDEETGITSKAGAGGGSRGKPTDSERKEGFQAGVSLIGIREVEDQFGIPRGPDGKLTLTPEVAQKMEEVFAGGEEALASDLRGVAAGLGFEGAATAMTSPEFQAYESSTKVSEGILRVLTGAAATDPEVVRIREAFGIVPGMDPEVAIRNLNAAEEFATWLDDAKNLDSLMKMDIDDRVKAIGQLTDKALELNTVGPNTTSPQQPTNATNVISGDEEAELMSLYGAG